jgi:hypothetical protein
MIFLRKVGIDAAPSRRPRQQLHSVLELVKAKEGLDAKSVLF